ncbi:hypothetical protein [Caballeronia grimmiae]|uniref:hypothetical protein n=1 Tax=Caballeronia grimmiae TaxID=1071679 RepID=UPI000AE0EF44|nr:hypothetical protein [Caballeronia grimmiae]
MSHEDTSCEESKDDALRFSGLERSLFDEALRLLLSARTHALELLVSGMKGHRSLTPTVMTSIFPQS